MTRDPNLPAFERLADGSFRFTDRRGKMASMRFHGYDVVIRDGRTRRIRAESPGWTHRLFIQADEARWTYAFASGEDRRLEEAALDRQFAASTYAQLDRSRADPR